MLESTTLTGANEKLQEQHMKQMKRQMECWREIILLINSVLMWEQSWYPGLIIGITTIIFLLTWFMEPAVLTVIAVCLLLLAVGDYFGPILISMIFSNDNWNGQKERKFNEIVRSIHDMFHQLHTVWNTALWARTNHTSIYCGILTTVLIVLGLIGNAINNLFLLYILVNSLLLLPGLHQNFRIDQPLKFIWNYLSYRKLT